MASNDPRNWAKNKNENCQIQQIITSRLLKHLIFLNAFSQSKGHSRKTWQTINELTSRRTNNTTVKELKLNGSLISNSSELSNVFDDHVSTTGLHLANEVTDNWAFNIDR